MLSVSALEKNNICSVCVCVAPLEVHSSDVEDDPFQPQDHEESLGEGTVADALPITASLTIHTHTHKNRFNTHTHTYSQQGVLHC